MYKNEGQYKLLIWSLIIIPFAVVLGSSISLIYDSIFESSIYDTNQVFIIINLLLFVGYILIDIYPFYRKIPSLFPSYYPIQKGVEAFINLFIQSLRYYSVFVLSVYISFYYFSNFAAMGQIIKSIFFVYSGFLINRILKNILEHSITGKKIIGAILLTLVVVFFHTEINLITSRWINLLLFIIYFTSLMALYFITETKKKECFNNKYKNRYIRTSNWYMKLLRNTNISKSYPYAFFFKILYLSITVLFLNTGSEPPMSEQTMWMFASPLVILVFAGVNFFGANRNLWLVHTIRPWNKKHLAKVYFYSMGILIFVDSLIFWAFILLSGFNQLENIIFYYIVALMLLTGGFWFSINKPNLSGHNPIIDLSFFRNQESFYNFWGIAFLISLYFVIEYLKGTEYFILGSCFIFLMVVLLNLVNINQRKVFQETLRQVKLIKNE